MTLLDWHEVVDLAKNGGLVLGLAISLYTVYSYVEMRIRRRRAQYALLKNMYDEFSYFIGLASALAKRAGQAHDLYVQYRSSTSYPSPAADEDLLPDDAEVVCRWLVRRAYHLTGYPLPVDMEKLGILLNRRQADALFALLTARRGYVQVLATRAMDLEAFPRRPGVFFRFVGVTALNNQDLNDKLQAFAKTLGMSTPGLAETSAA
jgi:hypothetical protein